MNLPRPTLRIESSGEPLLSRVPTRDEQGKALSDLMVLLPGLRDKTQPLVKRIVDDISRVLDGFADAVVFAELDIRRNMLWVSVRPIRNIRAAIATEIRAKVPDAKLVSHL